MAKEQDTKLTLLNLHKGFVKLDLFPDGCQYRYGLAPKFVTEDDSAEYVLIALYKFGNKVYYANILRLAGLSHPDVNARVPLTLFDIDSEEHKAAEAFHRGDLQSWIQSAKDEIAKLNEKSEALAKQLKVLHN